jgi:ribosomal protein S18 acetylase RimI-like enzyme
MWVRRMSVIMGELFRKSVRVIKEEGVGAFPVKALKRLLILLFRTNNALWFKRELSKPILSQRPDQEMRVDFWSRDRIIKWLRENNTRFPWLYIEREIKVADLENHLYPFILYNGNIIGYVKIAFNRVFIQDFNKIIKIPSENAFIYDTFIMPEHRHKHVGTFLLSEAMKHLKTGGYERLWCHIPPWNAASLNLYQNAGFEKVLNIRFYSLANFRFFNDYPERIMFG